MNIYTQQAGNSRCCFMSNCPTLTSMISHGVIVFPTVFACHNKRKGMLSIALTNRLLEATFQSAVRFSVAILITTLDAIYFK